VAGDAAGSVNVDVSVDRIRDTEEVVVVVHPTDRTVHCGNQDDQEVVVGAEDAKGVRGEVAEEARGDCSHNKRNGSPSQRCNKDAAALR
jgi:hypothetical protein